MNLTRTRLHPCVWRAPWLLVAALVLIATPSLALLGAKEAHAQGAEALDEARRADLLKLLRLGNEAYNEGLYDAALAYYDEGLKVAELPEIFYRKGLCLEKLSRPGEAIVAYERFLALSPEAKDRGRIEKDIERLRRLSTERELAHLELFSTPSGATIWREGDGGGEPLGKTPLKIDVEPGTLVLRFSADGHVDKVWRMVANAGERPIVEVTLDPVVQEGAGVDQDTDWRTIGWVTLGGGGLLAATAAGLAVLTEDRIGEANALDRAPPNTRADLNALQDPIPAMKVATFVLGTAAIASLIAGALMVGFDEPAQDHAADSQLEWSVDPRGAALHWRLAF